MVARLCTIVMAVLVLIQSTVISQQYRTNIILNWVIVETGYDMSIYKGMLSACERGQLKEYRANALKHLRERLQNDGR